MWNTCYNTLLSGQLYQIGKLLHDRWIFLPQIVQMTAQSKFINCIYDRNNTCLTAHKLSAEQKMFPHRQKVPHTSVNASITSSRNVNICFHVMAKTVTVKYIIFYVSHCNIWNCIWNHIFLTQKYDDSQNGN